LCGERNIGRIGRKIHHKSRAQFKAKITGKETCDARDQDPNQGDTDIGGGGKEKGCLFTTRLKRSQRENHNRQLPKKKKKKGERRDGKKVYRVGMGKKKHVLGGLKICAEKKQFPHEGNESGRK